MRGVFVIGFLLLVLPAAIALEELNTTTVEAGDFFRLDDLFVDVQATYEGNVSLRINGWGRIMSVDDCRDSELHRFCLEAADNQSADITFYDRQLNVTFTKTFEEEGTVGEEYEVEIRISNNRSEQVSVTLREYTNLTVVERTGLDEDMEWSGTLQAGQAKRVGYTYTAPRAGMFISNTTMESVNDQTRADEIEISDPLDVRIEYESAATKGKEYNITVEVDADENTEYDLSIIAPDDITILDHDNLTRTNRTFRRTASTNESALHRIGYRIDERTDTNITVQVTTGESPNEVSRTYTADLNVTALDHVILIHDHNGSILPLDEDTELAFTLLNPNPYELPVNVEVASVLVSDDSDLTLAANGTQELIYTVRPNASGSTYNLRFTFSYDDPDGESISVIENVRLHAETPQQRPRGNTTRNDTQLPTRNESFAAPHTLTVLAPEQATGEGFDLSIIVLGFENTTGILQILQNNETVLEENVTLAGRTPLPRHVNGSGEYLVTLHAQGQTLEERLTVRERSQPAPAQTEDTWMNWTTMILALVIVVAAGAVGWYATSRTRAHVDLEDLRREVRWLEAQVRKDEAFLSAYQPATDEQYMLRERFSQALQQRRQQLQAKRSLLADAQKQ